MSTDEFEHRQKTLDHMVDERFAEIFFLTKEEFNVQPQSPCEKELYDMLETWKSELKVFCETKKRYKLPK